MFESVEPEPITSIIRRKTRGWRGMSDWPQADAVVYSCVWKDDGEGGGTFKTSFTYKVADIPYAAHFSQSGGRQTEPPFAPEDRLVIQYSPANPQKCFYANAFTMSEKVSIGLIILFIFLLVHWLLTGSIVPSFSSE